MLMRATHETRTVYQTHMNEVNERVVLPAERATTICLCTSVEVTSIDRWSWNCFGIPRLIMRVYRTR
jgi:hypothetical protein